jgi:hypothetical protein
MMSDLNLMLSSRRRCLPLATGLAVLLATCLVAAKAGTGGASDDAYTWSAELVGFDEAAGVALVKALVAGHANLEDLPSLSEGDRVTITWSGLTRGTAIRSITRASETAADGLTLAAEFVSTQRDDRYLVFRIPVPSEAVARISALSPGTWVTLTSPRSPADWDEAVVDARPYNHAS